MSSSSSIRVYLECTKCRGQCCLITKFDNPSPIEVMCIECSTKLLYPSAQQPKKQKVTESLGRVVYFHSNKLFVPRVLLASEEVLVSLKLSAPEPDLAVFKQTSGSSGATWYGRCDEFRVRFDRPDPLEEQDIVIKVRKDKPKNG